MAAGGVVLVLMAAGDGGESGPEPSPMVTEPSGTGDGEEEPPEAEAPDGQVEPAEPLPVLPESKCPPGLSNCVVASGRILYVEKVDPDGDGDAHFVTASTDSVTGPGITIFDVKPELRPDPLPGVGQLIGGAGPVYPGSAGQEQVEVIEFHVAE